MQPRRSIALVPGDTLFTITVREAPDTSRVCPVTMTSRTLDGHKLTVRFEWGEHVELREQGSWRRTHWTFRYAGQTDDELDEWQQVSGMVRLRPEPEELDSDEQFARALLARVGQRVAVVEGEELRRTT